MYQFIHCSKTFKTKTFNAIYLSGRAAGLKYTETRGMHQAEVIEGQRVALLGCERKEFQGELVI